MTKDLKKTVEQIESSGHLRTDIQWVNIEKPEMQPYLHKYAVDSNMMPFILLFDLGIPVFGE